jgi:ABC-type proline/glycine betaine transport system substrate-binding protein
VGATPGVNGNLGQTLGALFGCGIGWHVGPVHTSNQNVYRYDDKEVNRGGNQQERHQGIDEVTQRKNTVVYSKADGGKIWLADQCRDRRPLV